MLYLMDASALITAHNTYLALHRVPEFWEWILHHGADGSIKLPKDIYEEVEDGHDALADWMNAAATKEALLSPDDANLAHVRHVMAQYGGNFTDADAYVTASPLGIGYLLYRDIVQPIPEPGSLSLLLVSLAGLWYNKRFKLRLVTLSDVS